MTFETKTIANLVQNQDYSYAGCTTFTALPAAKRKEFELAVYKFEEVLKFGILWQKDIEDFQLYDMTRDWEAVEMDFYQLTGEQAAILEIMFLHVCGFTFEVDDFGILNVETREILATFGISVN
jgi:hypothetical protein